MNTALINPQVLRWAYKRSHLYTDELADKMKVKPEKLSAWETGEAKPTFRQAQKLAKALKVPFGYLFLQKPPVEVLPIPDMRTIKDKTQADVSPDLRDVLTDVLYKQAWYRDYLLGQGVVGLPFVGKFDVGDKVQKIADDMAETLHLTVKDRNKVRSWEEFLRLFIKRAEDAGIWVMRGGIVGNNTHRPLNVQEFRGFAISDTIAPLVFINGKDAKAAQIFTLAHELAHIWLGQSAISNITLDAPLTTPHQSFERQCNAIAAELLTPLAEFKAHWRPNQTLVNNAQNMATHFRVSTVVVARRALELGFVNWDEFQQYYQQQVSIWRRQAEQKGKKPTSGNFYRTLPVRNGKHFTEAVLISASERRLLLRDAGRLLGIQPSKLVAFAKEADLG